MAKKKLKAVVKPKKAAAKKPAAKKPATKEIANAHLCADCKKQFDAAKDGLKHCNECEIVLCAKCRHKCDGCEEVYCSKHALARKHDCGSGGDEEEDIDEEELEDEELEDIDLDENLDDDDNPHEDDDPDMDPDER